MTNTIEGQGTKINIDLEYGGRLQTMVEGCRTVVYRKQSQSSHRIEYDGRSWKAIEQQSQSSHKSSHKESHER